MLRHELAPVDKTVTISHNIQNIFILFYILQKFQTCDEVVKAVESGAQNLEQDLAGILTPCGSLFLSAFQSANVPFANLLNLRSCPTENYGTKTTDAFMAAFAKNCPGQEINVP